MRIAMALAWAAAGAAVGCSSPGFGPDERVMATQAAVTSVSGSAIASLALANVGQGACTTNTLGGTHFESSCTGNGGQPEYWCADFAIWAWANSGADVSGLTAAAGSFYVYGQNNGTLSNTPALGAAAVFNYQGGGVADHVAIVSKVNGDGTIETVSGDWNGSSGTEAQFASTSQVVLNAPAYASTVGSSPGVMGMTISGFIAPIGGLASAAQYGATYVGQSFPLAATALEMTAGQTLAAYIELKNSGSAAWDSKTHLGTTQPRDRASAFAASTWLEPDRPAGVTGTVAAGDTYKFTFELHAPSKPGTYFEYFDLVEEGIAWFGDPGQGGPPDNDLEVQIVVAADPQAPQSDAGVEHDAGAEAGRGAEGDAGRAGQTVSDDAGTLPSPSDDAGPSNGEAAAPQAAGAGGGCTMAPAPGEALPGQAIGWLAALGAFGWIARVRRRGPPASR